MAQRAPQPQPREIIEHTIQRLLDEAQRLIWELDDSDGDPDLEPSLGSVAASQWADQRDWAEGASDEREEQCEDEGAQDERDPEPSEGGYFTTRRISAALSPEAGDIASSTRRPKRKCSRQPGIGSSVDKRSNRRVNCAVASGS